VRKIHWIVVHCSDSDRKEHDSIEVIRKWHVDERGFSDVGYHFVITKDGTVHKGRPEDKVGAHVKNHNSSSIGICLTGKNDFTPSQFKSLEILLIDICGRHDLEKKDILGHCDLDGGKTCPNFDLHQLLSSWEWH
jgi:N-acetylmuramoyl-L-alanine amidase